MGKTGVSRAELYSMRWNEFVLFLRGMVENEYGATAYLLREIIYQSIVGNPHIDRQYKPVKPTDLMLFPFEEMPVFKVITKQEQKEMVKAFKL